LERFWTQIAGQRPAPSEAAAADRPPVLNRGLPPLSADQKQRVQELAREAEAALFAAGDVLERLERPQFQFRSGCAYCHEEDTTRPRRDGLPTYKPPGLRDRWQGVTLPHERFARTGGRGRWFPYAKFSHESHRMLDCAGCHAGAAT